MHVAHAIIKNIRGFGDENRSVDLDFRRADRSLAGWTVVAGRNGAGKSTFLRAIALALVGPDAARTLSESFRDWIREGEQEAEVTLEIAYDDEHDRFRQLGKRPKSPITATLRWTASSETAAGVVGRVEPVFSQVPKQQKSGPWRGPWLENPEGWFVCGYGPFRRLSGHAADAQRLMVAPNHVSRLVSLFREDASLVECVQWLKEIYLRRLEKRSGAQELEQTVIELLNDGLMPDGVLVESVDSDGLWIIQNGRRLNLRELSDGYRVVAALVLDILKNIYNCFGNIRTKRAETGSHLQIEQPGVVLIDEIDAHLHVSWQRNIGFWLKSRFPKIQFIVSSHSPFVCQAADSNGLVRLPAPTEDEPASHLSSALFRRVKYGTSDDAVLSSLFGLERSWSEESDQLRRELAQLRLNAIRGITPANSRQRIRQLEMDLGLSQEESILDALLTRGQGQS